MRLKPGDVIRLVIPGKTKRPLVDQFGIIQSRDPEQDDNDLEIFAMRSYHARYRILIHRDGSIQARGWDDDVYSDNAKIHKITVMPFRDYANGSILVPLFIRETDQGPVLVTEQPTYLLKLSDSQGRDLLGGSVCGISPEQTAILIDTQITVTGSCRQGHPVPDPRKIWKGSKWQYGKITVQIQTNFLLDYGTPGLEPVTALLCLSSSGDLLCNLGTGQFYDFDHQRIRTPEQTEYLSPLSGYVRFHTLNDWLTFWLRPASHSLH